MTTGGSLQNRQVPRTHTAVPVPLGRTRTATTPLRTMQPIAAFSGSEADEFQLNLADLPRSPTGLHVDGFAPSLVSRLFDFFDRLRKS